MTSKIKENILGLKYKNQFLGINRKLKPTKNKDYSVVVDAIIENEKRTGKNIMIWDEPEIVEYLKSFKSISPNSLIKRLVYLRVYADFIAEMEGVNKRQYAIVDTKVIDCIDREKLMSLTVDYEEYQTIKSQLPDDYNVRDKLIISLAWEGLTKDEMKYLKEKDVEFIESDMGEVALLRISVKKVLKIESPDVVEELKMVINERTYKLFRNNHVVSLQYKESPYLLKPVQVGHSKNDDPSICHPSLVINNALKNNNVILEGVNLEKISVEDIRRSKLMYLLSDENADYFDNALIASIFHIKNEVNLYWLKQMAAIKYK